MKAALETQIPSLEHRLSMTNRHDIEPTVTSNNGNGEVADDELPLIPTHEEVDDE